MMHCKLESESNSTVLGAVYEYDLSNKEERDLGTTNAPLTHDPSVRIWVSANGFSKSLIYWGVKLFMALYVKTVGGLVPDAYL